MSRNVVFDLVADLIARPAGAPPATGPATAANPANAEDPRGSTHDLSHANELRIPANSRPPTNKVASDSQNLAASRSLENGQQNQETCGSSQKSQTSQAPNEQLLASTAAYTSRTCANCRHMLRRGTCAQPEAAGLFAPGHGFGIAIADEGHATICPVFELKVTAPATTETRPYRLSMEGGNLTHAVEWDDVTIDRFLARAEAFQRRGLDEQDAEDLAEKLTLRDLQRDDRILCMECARFDSLGRCRDCKGAGLGVAAVGNDLATTLQRCPAFEAAPGMPGAPSMPSAA